MHTKPGPDATRRTRTRNEARRALIAAREGGASVEALASKIPTSANTVTRWLDGAKPSYFLALRILEVFGRRS